VLKSGTSQEGEADADWVKQIHYLSSPNPKGRD